MPKLFLSPSTQEWNNYTGGGTEEEYMNLLADRMEPYLRASGITYVRNDPDRNVSGAINDSNLDYYDVHLVLHSNAAPESMVGLLRGIDIYYSPYSTASEKLAVTIANNLKSIYPIPALSRALPTTTLGEVNRTRAVAVLCELGYHDNIQDVEWLRNNLEAIATNLMESLCDYFGLPFVTPIAVVKGTVVTDGSGLNLRSYLSLYSDIIDSILDGAEVTIYGNVNNWYVISYNGVIGYVFGDFIRID